MASLSTGPNPVGDVAGMLAVTRSTPCFFRACSCFRVVRESSGNKPGGAVPSSTGTGAAAAARETPEPFVLEEEKSFSATNANKFDPEIWELHDDSSSPPAIIALVFSWSAVGVVVAVVVRSDGKVFCEQYLQQKKGSALYFLRLDRSSSSATAKRCCSRPSSPSSSGAWRNGWGLCFHRSATKTCFSSVNSGGKKGEDY